MNPTNIWLFALYIYSISVSLGNFLNCPRDESVCKDDTNCGDSAMTQRAGYNCNQWPFYSGGLAECCDINIEDYECTHAVYSYETNQVFCDFWYMYQQRVADELQLCDCKVNDGRKCISWICAVISDYDFSDIDHENSDILSKLLLPNQVEIFGVHECGLFDDHALIDENVKIPQYCYKYDDYKSCFCVPSDHDTNYCENWICHTYENNAKNDLSLETDYEDPNYQNYWNISDYRNITTSNGSSAIDMLRLSTEVSTEEYRCTMHHSNTPDSHNPVDESECTQWVANIKYDDKFAVQECGTTTWNSDDMTFRDFDPETQSQEYKQLDLERGNVTYDDLIDTYGYKWECKESGMDYRDNGTWLHFYGAICFYPIVSISLIMAVMSLIRNLCEKRLFCKFSVVQFILFAGFGVLCTIQGGIPAVLVYIFVHIIFIFVIVKVLSKQKKVYQQQIAALAQEADIYDENNNTSGMDGVDGDNGIHSDTSYIVM